RRYEELVGQVRILNRRLQTREPEAVTNWGRLYPDGIRAPVVVLLRDSPGRNLVASREQRQVLLGLLVAAPPSHGVGNHIGGNDRSNEERATELFGHDRQVGHAFP